MQSTFFSGFNNNIFSQSPPKGQSYRRQLIFDDNSDSLSQSTEASQDFQSSFSSFGRATKSADEISFNFSKKLSFETSEKTDFGMSRPQEQSKSMTFMETEIDNSERTMGFSETNENTMIIEEDTFFNAFTQNENKNFFAARNNRENDNVPNIFDHGLAITRRHDSFEELTNNFEKAEQFENIEFADNAQPTPSLPVINNIRDPALWTITPSTLVNLMNDQSKRYLIIDCRYGYEYQGGHIEGAINIETVEDLEKLLIINRTLLSDDLWLNEIKQNLQGVLQNYHLIDSENVNATSEPPILVFHCEFSQKRGPRAFRALRELDRQLSTYPSLHYPEVYLLEGGFENFNKQSKEACTENGTYVRMIDENYKRQYAIAKEIERKSWKKGVKKTLNPKTFSQRSRTMTCIDRIFSLSQ